MLQNPSRLLSLREFAGPVASAPHSCSLVANRRCRPTHAATRAGWRAGLLTEARQLQQKCRRIHGHLIGKRRRHLPMGTQLPRCRVTAAEPAEAERCNARAAAANRSNRAQTVVLRKTLQSRKIRSLRRHFILHEIRSSAAGLKNYPSNLTSSIRPTALSSSIFLGTPFISSRLMRHIPNTYMSARRRGPGPRLDLRTL
jgi:hypothetical protein